jgi:hypothetical protein
VADFLGKWHFLGKALEGNEGNEEFPSFPWYASVASARFPQHSSFIIAADWLGMLPARRMLATLSGGT